MSSPWYKNRKFSFMAAISLLTLLFSMVMLALSSFYQKDANEAIYLSLITYVLGVWTPKNIKTDKNPIINEETASYYSQYESDDA